MLQHGLRDAPGSVVTGIAFELESSLSMIPILQVKRVRCEASGVLVPKDKAIKRFIVRNIVDASAIRDIQDSSVIDGERQQHWQSALQGPAPDLSATNAAACSPTDLCRSKNSLAVGLYRPCYNLSASAALDASHLMLQPALVGQLLGVVRKAHAAAGQSDFYRHGAVARDQHEVVALQAKGVA